MELLTTPTKISSIAADLRNMIKKSNYRAGTRLMSTRQLAEKFNVSPKTVKCALDVLQQERLIRCEHGRGVFVEQQSVSGEQEIYVFLWGMRREPCNYYEEILKIAYPPALRSGYSFTVRTVFKDSDDFTHFDQEIARIENSPRIRCVFAASTHFNTSHFEKLSQLHCPVVYFGDSKYEEAVDYPRNRIIDTSDWVQPVFSQLQQLGAKEFTLFIPDGSIIFFREATRRIVQSATRMGMGLNLHELPCSVYNETDYERITEAYARCVRKAIEAGQLDCPIVIYGAINGAFMTLPEIKERLEKPVAFIEPVFSRTNMAEFYSATFDLIAESVSSPADFHIRKVCPPVRLHDYSSGRDYVFGETNPM